MSATTSRAATAPRIPWRILAVAAIIAILALAAALFAGSRRHVPAPFGLAANGLVAYAKNGDIYTADPVTGKATAVITGVEQDSDPAWSLDGTMLAFRRTGVDTLHQQLWVAAADGSGLRSIGSTLPNIGEYSFSPDGRSIAFTAGDDSARTLWVADVRQGTARPLALEMNAGDPSWLPPSGEEIVFDASRGGQLSGLYAVNPATNDVRQIVAPVSPWDAEVPSVSPDGSRIAYSSIDGDVHDGNSYRVHVVNIDGSHDRILPLPAGARFQDRPIWSNDGTRLIVTRGYAAHNEDMRLAIVPADGTSTGIETKPHITGCCDTYMRWSPDDSSILVEPEDLNSTMTAQLLIDPSTGVSTDASWGAVSFPAWQRR